MAVLTRLCFLFLLPLAAWAGTSADYSIDPAALDGGGATVSSAAYTINPSTAAGAFGASANYELRSGYAGQIDGANLVDTIAPVVAVHGNVTVEATSADGATVTYAAGSATDAVGVTSLTYSQNSGTVFPIGTTTVTITARDAANNTGTGTFTVTVTNNAPVVTLVGANPLTFEAAASYTDPGATATDVEDGVRTPSITSNTVVANVPGTYAVTWSATDILNATGSATRVVNVVDTTAPVVAAHGNVTVEATSADGATVTYAAGSATDAVGVTSLTYSQNSGTVFPIGTTTVTITARDAANNTGTGTFTVTVQDTTAPTIGGTFFPLNIVAGTPLPDYTGQATTSDAVAVISVTQSPAAGTATAVGTIPVTLTAHDAEGHTADVSFDVTVTPGDPVSTEIAGKGGVASGITNAKFVSFGNPAVNSEGHTAFYATVTGTSAAATTALMGKTKGIWADDSTGTRQLIARVGDTAVGTSSAVFSAMSDPVYNGNEEVAFRGTLKTGVGEVTSTPTLTANNLGIWSNNGGTLHLVARRGEQAPGCPSGATFSAFTQIVLPDQGGVVMLANLNSGTVALPGPGGVTPANNIGIWAVDTAGDLQLVVRKGDIYPATGNAITALSFLPAPTGVSGQSRNFSQSTGDLLCRANFSDGTSGVFRVTASTSLVAGQVIVNDQFSTSTGRPLPPQILTSAPQNVNLPGGVWSGKGAVGLGAFGTPDILSLGSKQVLKLTGDIGAVVPLMSNGGYTKPTLIRLQTTFNLGTTTGLGTTRSAGLGFWSSATEGHPKSYIGFYGVTVDRNGSVKLNLNPSDSTPLVSESLPNAGDWSASAWHTLAFSVNTNTGEVFDVMMDGIFYNFTSPVSAFTNANTDYAGILVSSDAFDGKLYVDSFQVSDATLDLEQPVVAKGARATGITDAKFTSFGYPTMNDEGNTAFCATVTGASAAATTALMGNNTGIWADNNSGARQLVVRKGDTAAGTGGAIFSAFGVPVYNVNEEIAFKGTLKVGVGGVTSTPALTANNNGIWSNTGGPLHLVAQRGAQAPGCPTGATFSAFTSFVLPDQGGVVMLANLNSGTVALPGPGGVTGANNLGIWAVDMAGVLKLVVRKGDTHPANGKTITGLQFLPVSPFVSGQSRNFSQGTGDIVYKATFSDMTTGIYKVVFP